MSVKTSRERRRAGHTEIQETISQNTDRGNGYTIVGFVFVAHLEMEDMQEGLQTSLSASASAS